MDFANTLEGTVNQATIQPAMIIAPEARPKEQPNTALSSLHCPVGGRAASSVRFITAMLRVF